MWPDVPEGNRESTVVDPHGNARSSGVPKRSLSVAIKAKNRRLT